MLRLLLAAALGGCASDVPPDVFIAFGEDFEDYPTWTSFDRGVDPILKGLATLQAATLRLDKADYAEMQKRLDGLANGKSAWRFSARELLGLSAFQHKDFKSAEAQFSALLGDPATPPNMRDRANMMLALIVSGTGTDNKSQTN